MGYRGHCFHACIWGSSIDVWIGDPMSSYVLIICYESIVHNQPSVARCGRLQAVSFSLPSVTRLAGSLHLQFPVQESDQTTETLIRYNQTVLVPWIMEDTAVDDHRLHTVFKWLASGWSVA